MCSSTHKSMGWKGWSTIPAPHLTESNAPWLDLSYPLGKSTPVPTVPAGKTIVSPFPEARFERIRSMPEHKVNLSEMQMVVHFGTHVDAPVHFIIDGPSFHEIPLDRLYGQGVLLNITCKPVQELGPEIFDGLEIQRGDIVVLNTGWSNYANTARYDEHPYLSAEAAQYLVDCGVKLFFPHPISL
jgi:arylformamidase